VKDVGRVVDERGKSAAPGERRTRTDGPESVLACSAPISRLLHETTPITYLLVFLPSHNFLSLTCEFLENHPTLEGAGELGIISSLFHVPLWQRSPVCARTPLASCGFPWASGLRKQRCIHIAMASGACLNHLLASARPVATTTFPRLLTAFCLFVGNLSTLRPPTIQPLYRVWTAR
jgi:hypothetical protein